MKVKDVLSCSLPMWYHRFRACTIKSKIIRLPENVLTYLQDGGTLVLPEDDSTNSRPIQTKITDSDEEWENTPDSKIATAPNLTDFNTEINNAIVELCGKAFPKLNWSSPKDASWISFNKSLECCCPDDVYLLLKSSNFVAHDLSCPFKDCDNVSESEDIEYYLVLREWVEINPSDEFRCFVKNGKLVGICQRDASQYYYNVSNNILHIKSDVVHFWKRKIKDKFQLASYVFDVHRPKCGKITLIDFGPFGVTTDGLLFSWDELTKKDENSQLLLETLTEEANRPTVVSNDFEDISKSVEFRYIQDDSGVQPSPYMQYGLPTDVLDISRGMDPLKLVDFLKMKIQDGNDSSSEDEIES